MTNRTNNCAHIQDMLDEYRRDSLPETEMANVRTHLAKCDVCADELQFRETLAAQLRDSLPVAQPPAEMTSAVRDAIANPRPKLIDNDRKRLSLVPWVFAAAALLIFGIAFFETQKQQLLKPGNEIATATEEQEIQPSKPTEGSYRFQNQSNVQTDRKDSAEMKKQSRSSLGFASPSSLPKENANMPAAAPAMVSPPPQNPQRSLDAHTGTFNNRQSSDKANNDLMLKSEDAKEQNQPGALEYQNQTAKPRSFDYDSTNGTGSVGDVYRSKAALKSKAFAATRSTSSSLMETLKTTTNSVSSPTTRTRQNNQPR